MFEKKSDITMLTIIITCCFTITINTAYHDYNLKDPILVTQHPLEPGWKTDQHIDIDSHPIKTNESNSHFKITPENIKNLDSDINLWTPKELQKLSPQQAEAIEAAPLISLNREQFLALPIAHLNPIELSMVFKFENHIGFLPDSFVNELTDQQAKTIINTHNKFLTTYFTTDQIEKINTIANNHLPTLTPVFHKSTHESQREITSLNNQPKTMPTEINLSDFDMIEHPDNQTAPMPTNKPSWWRKLSPTLSSLADGLIKQFSPSSSLSIASDTMQQFARGTYDSKNDQTVDNAFRKLTTKQKDIVANDWLVQTKAIFAERQRVLQKNLSLLSKTEPISRIERNNQIALIKEQIQQNEQLLYKEFTLFPQKMALYLSPDEKLISLKNSAGMMKFECIDMSEINPTQSIEDQKQRLKDDGIINTYDADWWKQTTESINSQSLQNIYTDWISQDIIQKLNPEKSIIDQIKLSVLQLTKHQWKDFNPTIKTSIYTKLDVFLEKQHNKLKQHVRQQPTEPTREEIQPLQQNIQTIIPPLLPSQNHKLNELQRFAIHTSKEADRLATDIAQKRYELEKPNHLRHVLYTKDQTIEIYKKLFLESYQNLYVSLRNMPEFNHLSGQAYGDAIANVLAKISAKIPLITDIPKESLTNITKRYISSKGI